MSGTDRPAAPDPRRNPLKLIGQARAATAGYVDPDKAALRDQRRPLPSQQPEQATSATAERQNGGLVERQASATSPTAASDGKIGYRISQKSIDAIEDIQTLLKRRYRLKIRLRRIVEEAVLAAYEDLKQKGEISTIVQRLSATEERRKSVEA